MRYATAGKPDDWRKSCERASKTDGLRGMHIDDFLRQLQAIIKPLPPEHRKRVRRAYDRPDGSMRFDCLWVVPAVNSRVASRSIWRLYAMVTDGQLVVKDHGTVLCEGTLSCATQVQVNIFEDRQLCESCREREALSAPSL